MLCGCRMQCIMWQYATDVTDNISLRHFREGSILISLNVSCSLIATPDYFWYKYNFHKFSSNILLRLLGWYLQIRMHFSEQCIVFKGYSCLQFSDKWIYRRVRFITVYIGRGRVCIKHDSVCRIIAIKFH